jgi:hypothetical protein
MTKSNSLTPELAASLYASIGDRNARAFIDFLIEHPDQQFDSERMQQALSFAEHKQVALAAYEIGELAKSLGLARPWSEGQKGYLMTATTAELLDRARASSGVR